MWQKKRVWQVTTIIQLALCHLVTSHFQEIACNYTPKGQIRWPIFLLLLCMIVLTEITSKFPKPIIFRILVFSCHKMTLITIITRMPHNDHQLCFEQNTFEMIKLKTQKCWWWFLRVSLRTSLVLPPDDVVPHPGREMQNIAWIPFSNGQPSRWTQQQVVGESD